MLFTVVPPSVELERQRWFGRPYHMGALDVTSGILQRMRCSTRTLIGSAQRETSEQVFQTDDVELMLSSLVSVMDVYK